SDKVLNRLTVPDGSRGPGLAAQVQDAIGIPGVTVRLINGKLLLNGQVANLTQKENAEKVAAAMTDSPNSVINLLELPRLTIENLRSSLGAITPGQAGAPQV